jgi:hypothetical protein
VPFEPVGPGQKIRGRSGGSPLWTDPRPSNPSFASGNVGRLPDEDFCADLDAVVEVDHVGVVEAKASRRNGVPDRLRLVGSVDAEDGVTEIEGSRPEGIPLDPMALDDGAAGRKQPLVWAIDDCGEIVCRLAEPAFPVWRK